jgi:Tol biopolymer transport system component
VQKTLSERQSPAAPEEPAPPSPAAFPSFGDRYRIDRELGHGGMGRVYAARDLKLGRDVAIKVLTLGGTSFLDEQHLRRFEQEARAAGSLNHPNIVAVYDIGWSEGAPYIVTELLEGATLRRRLENKPLPLPKALDYALQLARGLAAAHEKGVVHRDLKPENLFVTREGRLKILDFGIAKLVLPDASGAALEAEEARTAVSTPKTETGIVMGTMGYMSPEQVRGTTADHRTDIFSAGAILYEMLSGTCPFERPTPVETGTATLNDEPPELPARVPLELDRIVRRCLEKNPDDRYQSAKDLALDLEGALAHPLARRRTRGWRAAAAAIALLVLAGAAAFFAGLRAGERPAPGFRQLTFRRGDVSSAMFARDGQTIVYSAAWEDGKNELYSARLQTGGSRALALDAQVLAVSPAEEVLVGLGSATAAGGQWQGGASAMLSQLPLAGGAHRDLLDDVSGADWTPDGSALAVVRDVGGRKRLEFPPGKVLYETTGFIGGPRFSPRGDLIAFVDHQIPFDDAGSVAVIDPAGNKRTLAADFGSVDGVAWSPSGAEVWFTAAGNNSGTGSTRKALFAVSLAGRQRRLADVPGSLKLLDVDRNGRALVAHQDIRMQINALPPGETKERDLSWFDFSTLGDLSNDGKTILFAEQGLGGIFIRKTDGSPAVRLGDDVYPPAFSPDGKWALAIHDIYGDAPRIVLLPTGPGQPVQLDTGAVTPVAVQWFPDGSRILFAGREPGHRLRLYLMPKSGGTPSPITAEGVEGAQGASYAISPDGKLIAVEAGGQLLLYAEKGEPQPIVELQKGEHPSGWGADAHSIFLYQSRPCGLYRLDLVSRRKELVRLLSPADPVGVRQCGLAKITPDGRSYAYRYWRQLSTLYLLEGLR